MLYIFGVVLAVVIFLILAVFISASADDTTFIQKVHVNNLAVTVGEMLVGKGEVIVNYKIEDKFNVSVGDGLITVGFKEFELKKKYPVDTRYKIEYDRKPGLLVLRKIERS